MLHPIVKLRMKLMRATTLRKMPKPPILKTVTIKKSKPNSTIRSMRRMINLSMLNKRLLMQSSRKKMMYLRRRKKRRRLKKTRKKL
jgi:hypothetical protein